MTQTLYVGCPMWAYRPWVGRYLPAATPPGRELAAYSTLVNAVEGNTTFYAVPLAATVQRWAGQVDESFRFVFKLPQTITHERRLRDVDSEVNAFVALFEPLQANVESLTVQLPASFAPRDLGALDHLLGRAPQGWRWSVEVRHLDFFAGSGRVQLDRLLQRHGAERVLLDSRPLFAMPPRTDEGRQAWERKPRVPAIVEPVGERPIVRFIGSDHPEPTAAGLLDWQPRLAEWLAEGRTPTFFVHTPDCVETPELARALHRAVHQLEPSLAPLPEPLPVHENEQPSLF